MQARPGRSSTTWSLFRVLCRAWSSASPSSGCSCSCHSSCLYGRRSLSLLIAYIIVGLSYGLRIIQATLLQVAPELEESARVTGAGTIRTWKDVVIPLVKPGLAGAWAMIMIVFLREYATGVYLMSAGTEVIGSLMVSLLTSGAMDQIAALSFISIVLTALGLTLALRLGAKIHD